MSTSTPVGRPTALPRLPVLDSLRGVWVLALVTAHTAFWAGSYTRNGVWGTLLARLDVGVALFFVLSGVLLSYPYLARAQQQRGTPPRRAVPVEAVPAHLPGLRPDGRVRAPAHRGRTGTPPHVTG